MRNMKYTHVHKDGVLFLKLEGNLIGENNGPEIIGLLNDEINNSIRLCAIDISDVKYINSSGIGVLITALTKFRNKDGEVVLIKPSESVKKLLIITKLNSIFKVTDTEEEALQLLKQEA